MTDILDVPEIGDVPEIAAPGARQKLTLRSPDEILAMNFDDSDIIFGDRLSAKGQPLVVAGAGGMGKSRLILQCAACVITGRKFLAFDTGGKDLPWLFLQTENSNRRLKDDLSRIRNWLTAQEWKRFTAQVTIHTVENDLDGFVSLDNMENQIAIERAIAETNPGIICIDPLAEFSIGDPNKDGDMRLTLQTLSRIARKSNPERALIVLQHALTGKMGAQKATGFDRNSFARNSKALLAWTRAQINLAPIEPDDNARLIVACGKNNNGREFPAFAVRLNPETMIYECDSTVDIAGWQADVSGKPAGPLMTPNRVRELCQTEGMSKPDLARAIAKDCGCARGTAYRCMARAERGRLIRWKQASELYFRN